MQRPPGHRALVPSPDCLCDLGQTALFPLCFGFLLREMRKEALLPISQVAVKINHTEEVLARHLPVVGTNDEPSVAVPSNTRDSSLGKSTAAKRHFLFPRAYSSCRFLAGKTRGALSHLQLQSSPPHPSWAAQQKHQEPSRGSDYSRRGLHPKPNATNRKQLGPSPTSFPFLFPPVISKKVLVNSD